MKRLLAAMVAALLMVSLVSSAAVATDGKGHNFVGSQTGITGAIHLPNFTSSSSHVDPLANPVTWASDGVTLLNAYDYTCLSVSRTAYGFGWKDTQTCTVTGGLPTKAYSSGTIVFNATWTNHADGSPLAINVDYGGCSDRPYLTNLNPTLWYSDWMFWKTYVPDTGFAVYQVASSFSYKLATDGTITITSFYPTVAIQDPCYGS